MARRIHAAPDLQDQECPTDRMPLAPAFRRTLEKASGETGISALCTLLDLCLDACTRAGPPPDSRHLLNLASALARHYKLAAVDPAVLAAACWEAARTGGLAASASLNAHVTAHHRAFETLLRHHDWVGAPNLCPASNDNDVPWSPALEALKAAPLHDLVLQGTNTALALKSRYRAAYHEAGHAVAFALLRPDIRIKEISVENSEVCAGVVRLDPPSGLSYLSGTRDGIYRQAICLFAGRAAEVKAYGSGGVNSGAASDLEQATAMLWDGITRCGLAPQLGPVSLKAVMMQSWTSGQHLAHQAERLLQHALQAADHDSIALVTQTWTTIEAVARALARSGRMTEDELRALIAKTGSPQAVFPVPSTFADLSTIAA